MYACRQPDREYNYDQGKEDYSGKEAENPMMDMMEKDGKSNFCSQFDKEFGGFWCEKATDAACEYWPELEKFLCQTEAWDYDQYWNDFSEVAKETVYDYVDEVYQDFKEGGNDQFRGDVGDIRQEVMCGEKLEYSSEC
jgi:hypothetical protein